MTILVVSAWLPEQRALRGKMESSASHRERERYEFLLTGIGPVRAAAVLGARLAKAPPVERVIFVGTAGAYSPASHPLRSAWRVTTVRFTDGGAVRGESYFPGAGESLAWEEWVSGEHARNAPEAPLCVCVPAITRTRDLAATLARIGPLENLELAGVAAACAAAGVPWSAFLGVSNEVGPESHSEWKRWHEEASAAAQELAASHLSKAAREAPSLENGE